MKNVQMVTGIADALLFVKLLSHAYVKEKQGVLV